MVPPYLVSLSAVPQHYDILFTHLYAQFGGPLEVRLPKLAWGLVTSYFTTTTLVICVRHWTRPTTATCGSTPSPPMSFFPSSSALYGRAEKNNGSTSRTIVASMRHAFQQHPPCPGTPGVWRCDPSRHMCGECPSRKCDSPSGIRAHWGHGTSLHHHALAVTTLPMGVFGVLLLWR